MDLMFKLPVLVVLGFIVFSLAQGMYYLAKDDGETDKTRVVRALTIRIVLSLTLFGLLILGYVFGLIEPHGVGAPPDSAGQRTRRSPLDRQAERAAALSECLWRPAEIGPIRTNRRR